MDKKSSDSENLVEEGNVLKYAGDIEDLPRCKKCNPDRNEDGEVIEVAEHELMTYDHPYKMKPEEKEEELNIDGEESNQQPQA